MCRKLLIVAVAALATCAVGYGSAYLRARDCGVAFAGELKARKVVGTRFSGGKVVPSVTLSLIRVRGPFLVSAQVTIPRDLHATWYHASYLALPWGVYRLSWDEISYV